MPEDSRRGAEEIPQTGQAAWFPPAEDDAEATLKASEPKGARYIFFGADGLRAGWSALLFLLLVTGFGYAVGAVVKHLHLGFGGHAKSTGIPVESVLLSDGFGFVAMAFAAWLVSRVEGRRFRQYGVGSLRPRFGQFAAGVVVGLLLLSLLVLGLKLAGLLVFEGTLIAGALPTAQWALLWFAAFLLVGLAEEFATRGFLQFTLARGIAGASRAAGMSTRGSQVLGFWLTATIFSSAFALGHIKNPGETSAGILSAGAIAMVFAFSLWRTGSLWWAIGFHAAWDWAQSFLYGVADSGLTMQHHLFATHPQGPALQSGGGTGPEGSVFALVAVALTAAVVARTLPPELGSPSDPAYSPNAGVLTR